MPEMGYVTNGTVYETDDPLVDSPHDHQAALADWIVCPHCGSDDADLIYWGEGVDTDVRCPDCGEHAGVR